MIEPDSQDKERSDSTPRRKGVMAFIGRLPPRMIALVLLIVFSAIFSAVALSLGWINPYTIRSVVQESGSLGMITYIVAVIILELLWIPRMMNKMAGGLLFGPELGAILAFTADILGSTLTYLLARAGGRKFVADMLAKRPKTQRIVDLLAVRRGTFTVALLRACPIGHFTLISYACGMSGVKARPYIIGTAIGTLPGAILYPVLGDAMLRPTSPTFLITTAILIVMVVVTVIYARHMFKESEQSVENESVKPKPDSVE